MSLLNMLKHEVKIVKARYPDGRFPERVAFFWDNTNKENKNHWVHNFVGLLFLRWGFFKNVEIIYPCVGHTHGPPDRVLSTLGTLILNAAKMDATKGLWIMHDIIRILKDDFKQTKTAGTVFDSLPALNSFLDWVRFMSCNS